MKNINSRSNPKFKMWKSLLEAKGVKAEGLCLVSGAKIVGELLTQKHPRVVELIAPPKGEDPAGSSGIPVTHLSGELFNELDVIGTKAALAVVEAPPLAKWTGGAPRGLNLILALSDPTNLGALIRSAEAFGVERIVLTKECASPFLPRTIRAASGSVFRVPLLLGPSLKDLTVEEGFGLDLTGTPIGEVHWPKDLYLVLGEEGQGLPANLNLTRVKIPMKATIDSLNATAAASVALFNYRQTFML